jgi:BirA family biotin operon repressor/biotin-[acetyl-CoA-carboxylase] ligase
VSDDRPSRPWLDVPSLEAALLGSPWRLEVVAESPSTNALVAERARADELPGLVVVAEHQSAGRGRLDRVWVTPPRAALTFSLLVRPDGVPVARWPWLPLLTGLAVAEAVTDCTGLDARVKWPNDVLVGDRKLAGILTERIERGSGPVGVVGVGLNVSSTLAELPVDTATSLVLAGAGAVDRGALLLGVLRSFGSLYDAWVAAGGGGLRESYADGCSTLGRSVRVELPGSEPLHGVAVGVDDDGRLLIDDGGRVRALGAGDVVHVRGH